MLRKDWDDLVKGKKGDWYFHHDFSYITIRYGKKVFDVVTIPIKGKTKWNWDGSEEAPTISPSIRILGRFGEPDLWHGFLVKGKLIDA